MTIKIAELNEIELALRIAEAMVNMERPDGIDADQAFATIEKENVEFAAGCRRSARATLRYLKELSFSSAVIDTFISKNGSTEVH